MRLIRCLIVSVTALPVSLGLSITARSKGEILDTKRIKATPNENFHGSVPDFYEKEFEPHDEYKGAHELQEPAASQRADL